MLGNKKFEAKFMYSVSLEDLVPEDNFYRKVNELLDLRFVYKRCKSLYGKTGKPSIDPVVFMKLNLYGYFENITSDRNLIRKASDSLSARLFIGYDIDEELPWHSTISRTRALMKNELFEELFNKVLELCVDSGLVDGEHQSIDSTLIRANASLDKLEKKKPELKLCDYIEKTFEENSVEDENKRTKETGKDDDNNGSNKQEIKLLDKPEGERKRTTSNEHYVSKTDPDSRIVYKKGNKTDLYYKTHYSVDSKKKIITNVMTTFADILDSESILQIVNRTSEQLGDLGLKIRFVSADRGYCSGENLRGLETLGIVPYIPSQKYANTRGGFSKDQFTYNKEKDEYTCPNNKVLKYRSRVRKQAAKYVCKAEDCRECKLKSLCLPGKRGRSIRHSDFYEEYESLSRRMRSSEGKNAMRLRKTGPEPLFGEAKLYHGLRKFMTRGIDKAKKNSIIIATVQNLKRLINGMNKNKKKIFIPNTIFSKTITQFIFGRKVYLVFSPK